MPRWRIKDEKVTLVEQSKVGDGISLRRFRFRLTTSQPEGPAELESHMTIEGELDIPTKDAPDTPEPEAVTTDIKPAEEENNEDPSSN